MDIIEVCLAITPVPYLSNAVSALRFIWNHVERVQVSNSQLRSLGCDIAQLLHTLDGEYRHQKLPYDQTSRLQLDELYRFVTFSIHTTVPLSDEHMVYEDY
jgi:hypothetical protein